MKRGMTWLQEKALSAKETRQARWKRKHPEAVRKAQRELMRRRRAKGKA